MEKVDLKLVTNACDMQDFNTWVATLHSSNPSCDVRPWEASSSFVTEKDRSISLSIWRLAVLRWSQFSSKCCSKTLQHEHLTYIPVIIKPCKGEAFPSFHGNLQVHWMYLLIHHFGCCENRKSEVYSLDRNRSIIVLLKLISVPLFTPKK